MIPPYRASVDEVLRDLTTSLSGLSSDEASRRLQQYGPNEIETAPAISPFKILLRQFRDFFIYLLIVAALITFFLGEYTDFILIAVVIVVNGLMGFYQEFKAEKTLERLREMTAPVVTVLRNGQSVQISAREAVPGDIVCLEEGDILAADGRMLESVRLAVSEAVLTGESFAVEKSCEPLASETSNPADMQNMVFSGTTVTRGRGKAVVTATGLHTEVGKIARLLSGTLTVETPLKKKIELFSRNLGVLIVALCLILFGLGMWQGGDPMELFLTVVSLAVATVPEALPIVITLILALGVQVMARRRALVRRLPAVETLGAVTVICSDKTGTLTRNEMTVQKVFLSRGYEVTGTGYGVDGDIIGLTSTPLAPTPPTPLARRFLEIAEHCNNAILGDTPMGDPTELALKVLVRKGGVASLEYRRVSEEPFDSASKRMSVIVEGEGSRLTFVKGAPEEVLDRCTHLMRTDGTTSLLEPADLASIRQTIERWADDAYRVLALAYASGDAAGGEGLVFTGLAALMDPPAEGVREAVEHCKSAGIMVVMITGDHLKTALAVARSLGIAEHEDEAIDGREFMAAVGKPDFEIIKARLTKVRVFARVTPEEKLLIVETLQKMGHVVAMTGDGVNDAPALKKAEVGIAMGIRGTEVAKEAADLILTDDNFVTIVAAVEEGRKIYANIKKAIFFLLKTNFGELIVVSFAFFASYPLVLTPLMILWINLVTDSLPALAFAREPVTPGLMRQPPRNPVEEILDARRIIAIVCMGGLLAVASLSCFLMLCQSSLQEARSTAFNVLSVGQLFMTFGFRDVFFRNPWMFGGFAVSLAAQIGIFYIPFTVEAMHLVAPTPLEWALIFSFATVLAFITYPVRKWAKI